MSQRIFLACSTYFQDIQIETEAELESEITKFNQNPNVLDFILKNADLEITNSIVAREYCREKVRIEVEYMYLKYFRFCHTSMASTSHRP